MIRVIISSLRHEISPLKSPVRMRFLVTSQFTTTASQCSFNTEVTRLSNGGFYREAIDSFLRMCRSGTKPTKFALCSILTCCCNTEDPFLGMQIHGHIVRVGHEQNLFLGSKLLVLYSNAGDTIQDARKVFDRMTERDLVLWTSMMTALSQNGHVSEAIVIFKEMLEDGIKPNSFAFACLISGCRGSGGETNQGKLFHAFLVKLGFEMNSHVTSSLIDFYAKIGEISESELVFKLSVDKDTVLFNSMISVYSQNMLGEDALKMFALMQHREFAPTSTTFASALNACGSLAVFSLGQQIHSMVTKMGLDRNNFVASSLVDMYSKCGSINDAVVVFNSFPSERNNILWTSLITGYSQNGRERDALKVFDSLVKEGQKPDNICFTSVLTACSHAGLLKEGLHYFKLMTDHHGIVPDLDHHTCMVDLYGRSGHLKEAKNLMNAMPFKPNAVMLSSFLGFCRFYGNMELAEEANAQQLFNAEPNCAAPYVTLANIYSKNGLWREAADIRKEMRSRGIKKSAGFSWIELDCKIYVFTVSDVSNPKSVEIYLELEKLIMETRDVRNHEPLLDFSSWVYDFF